MKSKTIFRARGEEVVNLLKDAMLAVEPKFQVLGEEEGIQVSTYSCIPCSG